MRRNVTTQRTSQFANFLLAVQLEAEEIGRRIKVARERKGWTQLKFSYEANVSPSSVQRWEAGKLPPVRELMRLADLLGVETDQFLEPEAKPDDDRLGQVVHELGELRGEFRAALARLESRLPE